jgi:hypothetical protein
MSGIFISYRREDSGGYAGRVSEWLGKHFGKQMIFMDIDTLKVGADFVKQLESAVTSCKVLLAVIGKQWVTIQDEQGQQRLLNSQDFVRAEIQMALNRGIPVIPLLVGGAKMPNATDLPTDLEAFARRHAFEISDKRFSDDMNRLILELEEYVPRLVPVDPSLAEGKSKEKRSMTRSAWIVSWFGVSIALGVIFKQLFPSVEVTTELALLLVLVSFLVVWGTHRVWQIVKGRWL